MSLRDTFAGTGALVFYDPNNKIIRIDVPIELAAETAVAMFGAAEKAIFGSRRAPLIIPAAMLGKTLVASVARLAHFLATDGVRVLAWGRAERPGATLPFVYEARVWSVTKLEDVVQGSNVLHLTPDGAAQSVCHSAREYIQNPPHVQIDQVSQLGSGPTRILHASRALGLCAEGDRDHFRIRIGEPAAGNSKPYLLRTIYYDPHVDHSPLHTPSMELWEHMHTTVRAENSKTVLMTGFNSVSFHAIMQRKYAMAFDMCGVGSEEMRHKKRYATFTRAGMRAAFLGQNTNLVVGGEPYHRFAYEMLLEFRRSFFYIDIDCKLDEKPAGNVGDDVSTASIDLMIESFDALFGVRLARPDFIVFECDRWDDGKWKISRHVIARKIVFESMHDVFIFAHVLKPESMRNRRRWRHLFRGEESLLDLSVYNVGRIFRPAMCAKAPAIKGGTAHHLRLAAVSEYPVPPDASEFDIFCLSLIQDVPFEEVPLAMTRRFVQRGGHFFPHEGNEFGCPAPEEAAKKDTKKRKIMENAAPPPSASRLRGNESGLDADEARTIFDEVRQAFGAEWKIAEQHADEFEIRIRRDDGKPPAVLLYRKRASHNNEGIYCGVCKEFHRKHPTQFYINGTPARGYTMVQRCCFGTRGQVLIFEGRPLPATAEIVSRYLQ
jgi:hypothetical protein